MFSESAQYYDALYSWKDYALEASQIAMIIQKEHPSASTILDVGCGTAEHLRFLPASYTMEGLDLDANLLEIAKKKFPDAAFHVADMIDFDLGRKFDVVMCLFSSIGYVVTKDKLNATLACFAKHLNPGGLVIVEPWFSLSKWSPGRIQMLTLDQDELKVCRMVHATAEGNLSVLEIQYLIAEKGVGLRHVQERHVLAMFEETDFAEAFRLAGLTLEFDPKGLTDRGMYLGSWI